MINTLQSAPFYINEIANLNLTYGSIENILDNSAAFFI